MRILRAMNVISIRGVGQSPDGGILGPKLEALEFIL